MKGYFSAVSKSTKRSLTCARTAAQGQKKRTMF